MSSKLTTYQALAFLAFIFAANITKAQEVKIPETYLNLKHLQVMDAYEGYSNEGWGSLDYDRNLTQNSPYHINIPITSLILQQ